MTDTVHKYSDISVSGKEPVTDANSLLQAIESLLQTQQRERIFLPNYGSDLEQFVFKTIDDWNAEEVRFHIQSVLEQDDRITINNIQVTADSDNNRFDVVITVEFESMLYSYTTTIQSKSVL